MTEKMISEKALLTILSKEIGKIIQQVLSEYNLDISYVMSLVKSQTRNGATVTNLQKDEHAIMLLEELIDDFKKDIERNKEKNA